MVEGGGGGLARVGVSVARQGLSVVTEKKTIPMNLSLRRRCSMRDIIVFLPVYASVTLCSTNPFIDFLLVWKIFSLGKPSELRVV